MTSTISFAGAYFGQNEDYLDDLSHDCTKDYTSEFTKRLCFQTHCKSPTLKLLDLDEPQNCPLDQRSPLGMWQITYICDPTRETLDNKTDIESSVLDSKISRQDSEDINLKLTSKSFTEESLKLRSESPLSSTTLEIYPQTIFLDQ